MGTCLRNGTARLHVRSARDRRNELGSPVASAGRRARIVPARPPRAEARAVRQAGALRTVALHHHLAAPPWRAAHKRPVRKRDLVLQRLASAGVELVLSGHVHQSAVAERREFEVVEDDQRSRSSLRPLPASGGRDRSAVERRSDSISTSSTRRASRSPRGPGRAAAALPRSAGGHFSVESPDVPCVSQPRPVGREAT